MNKPLVEQISGQLRLLLREDIAQEVIAVTRLYPGNRLPTTQPGRATRFIPPDAPPWMHQTQQFMMGAQAKSDVRTGATARQYVGTGAHPEEVKPGSSGHAGILQGQDPIGAKMYQAGSPEDVSWLEIVGFDPVTNVGTMAGTGQDGIQLCVPSSIIPRPTRSKQRVDPESPCADGTPFWVLGSQLEGDPASGYTLTGPFRGAAVKAGGLPAPLMAWLGSRIHGNKLFIPDGERQQGDAQSPPVTGDVIDTKTKGDQALGYADIPEYYVGGKGKPGKPPWQYIVDWTLAAVERGLGRLAELERNRSGVAPSYSVEPAFGFPMQLAGDRFEVTDEYGYDIEGAGGLKELGHGIARHIIFSIKPGVRDPATKRSSQEFLDKQFSTWVKQYATVPIIAGIKNIYAIKPVADENGGPATFETRLAEPGYGGATEFSAKEPATKGVEELHLTQRGQGALNRAFTSYQQTKDAQVLAARLSQIADKFPGRVADLAFAGLDVIDKTKDSPQEMDAQLADVAAAAKSATTPQSRQEATVASKIGRARTEHDRRIAQRHDRLSAQGQAQAAARRQAAGAEPEAPPEPDYDPADMKRDEVVQYRHKINQHIAKLAENALDDQTLVMPPELKQAEISTFHLAMRQFVNEMVEQAEGVSINDMHSDIAKDVWELVDSIDWTDPETKSLFQEFAGRYVGRVADYRQRAQIAQQPTSISDVEAYLAQKKNDPKTMRQAQHAEDDDARRAAQQITKQPAQATKPIRTDKPEPASEIYDEPIDDSLDNILGGLGGGEFTDHED